MGICPLCGEHFSAAWCLNAGAGGAPCPKTNCTGWVDTRCCWQTYSETGQAARRRGCGCGTCSGLLSAGGGYNELYNSRAWQFKETVELIFSTPELKVSFSSGLASVVERLQWSLNRRLSTTVDAIFAHLYAFVIRHGDPEGAHGLRCMPCPQRCPLALALLDQYEARGFRVALLNFSKCAAGLGLATSGAGGRHDEALAAIAGPRDLVWDLASRLTPCVRDKDGGWAERLGVCVPPSAAECECSNALGTVLVTVLKELSESKKVHAWGYTPPPTPPPSTPHTHTLTHTHTHTHTRR